MSTYIRRKVFSRINVEGEERLFSVKEVSFSKYDDTDEIKRMKDSDILAEKEKKNGGSYGRAAKSAVKGGVVGGALGAIGGGIAAAVARKRGINPANVKNIVRGAAALGAGTGAALAGGVKLAKEHEEREDNRRYNKRLRYAKHQAERREKRDWMNQSVSRDGYSY